MPPETSPILTGSAPAEILRFGQQQHQAGRLDTAEAAYRRVLDAAPQEPEALHLLGLVRLQRGQAEEAAALIGEAVRLRPDRAPYHANLALALRPLGRLDEAEASCREALALAPDRAEFHAAMGGVLQAAGRPADAEASYRRAVALKPGFLEALSNLGSVLRVLGRPQEAAASLRAALALQPDHPDLAVNLAAALAESGRVGQAAALYGSVLEAFPDHAAALFGLGKALHRLGRPAAAAERFRAVLALNPEQPETLTNLGFALIDAGEAVEAEAAFCAAVRLAPDLPEAQYGLGRVCFEAGRLAEAEGCSRAVLARNPDHVWSHFNLAHILLARGRFAEGWAEYEWRRRLPGADRRDFGVPLWQGEPLAGRRLLVHAEQGLGDTLEFCRYLPLIGGARLVVELQAPLVRLVGAAVPSAEIVEQGAALPPIDLHCPLLSLPRLFGTVMETIPAAIPYLAAEPAAVAHWRSRLAALPGRRVGLVWAGGLRPEQPELAAVDARRSIDLARLAPLAVLPGLNFVSLQKGPASIQALAPPYGMALQDYTAELEDFADTAALVEALDLVISVDTSVAHLVGALGKPVWLLNRFDSCWRWLQGRDDSPWYPTLRQFRQTAPGDWDGVVAAVAAALAAA